MLMSSTPNSGLPEAGSYCGDEYKMDILVKV